jgi:hypothetical protein
MFTAILAASPDTKKIAQELSEEAAYKTSSAIIVDEQGPADHARSHRTFPIEVDITDSARTLGAIAHPELYVLRANLYPYAAALLVEASGQARRPPDDKSRS